jgi:uncharacterized membrane-anchored protein
MHKYALLLTLLLLPTLAHAKRLPAPAATPAAEAATEDSLLDIEAGADEAFDEPTLDDEEAGSLADVATIGPGDIELGHDLHLALPEGFAFFEREQASEILESMGNFGNDDVLGMIVSVDESKGYFVVIEYFDPGWVDDKESLDADEILSALREGQRVANQERKARGFQALTLDGWAENPRYERALHHLVWAIRVSDSEGASINVSTRILGRRGFVSLDLVTDPATLDEDKADITALLSATTFAPGARYEDYDSETDKSSGLGIGALIAGGAIATKVGIFAKIGKFFLVIMLALKKFFIVIAAAIGVGIKKLFGRDSSAAEASAAEASAAYDASEDEDTDGDDHRDA